MKIKPLDNWKLAGTNLALDSRETYIATPAINQPNWYEEGKVFVEVPNKDGASILLTEDEYEVVEECFGMSDLVDNYR